MSHHQILLTINTDSFFFLNEPSTYKKSTNYKSWANGITNKENLRDIETSVDQEKTLVEVLQHAATFRPESLV